MIVFENVFLNLDRRRFDVIKGATLIIDTNQNYVLLGEKDSGKTSLIKLMLGLYKASSGRLTIDGVDISDISDMPLAYVSQDLMLKSNKTVYNNLAFPLKYRKTKKSELNSIIEPIASLYGIEINKKVAELSNVEKAVVALVRSTVRKPRMILVDDIAINFNQQDTSLILDCIVKLIKNGNNVFYTTSNVDHLKYLENFKILNIELGVITTQGNICRIC